LKTTLESWGHAVSEATDGAAALQALQSADAPRLAILDLNMPEMDGINVCRHVRENQKGAPVYIILLTSRAGKSDIVMGLGAGADDYVTKPFDPDELQARVKVGIRMLELQNSLAERVSELEQAQETLRNLSLTDDLTGLYNRRGFFTLADQHLKSTRRAKRNGALIFVDMDGLKSVNDLHGHEEGNNALRSIASVLRCTFRSSDIIARIGGDEFVILETYGEQEEAKTSIARLEENLQKHNAESGDVYKLSLSIGVAVIDVNDERGIDALLTQGDQLMYEAKRAKRNRHFELEFSALNDPTGTFKR
jgi:diguanylate cyclase (GGDEF)-like protein